MANIIEKWWGKICKGGFREDMDSAEKRYVYTLNVYWLISFLAYSFFLVLMLVLQQGRLQEILLSNLGMYLLFFVTRWLVLHQKPYIARHLLLVVINAGIFFYDYLVGASGWVFVFYIPFLFATISLFAYRASRWVLIGYVTLPAALFVFSVLFMHAVPQADTSSIIISPYFSRANFLLALVLVAAFAANVIRGNLNNLQQIERNRLNLQALIDNTADSVWSIDSNNIVTSANNVFKQDMKAIFGVQVRPGFDMNVVYARPDFPAIFKEHHRILFEKGTLHDVYTFFGDRHYEVFGTTYHNNEGIVSGASFHVRDITDIIRSGEDLQVAFINLQALIDNTHASIWSVDTQYKVIAANRIYKEDMLRIFDMHIKPGTDISQLFDHPLYPAEWLDHYRRVFSGEAFQMEYSFGGETYELMVAPIFGLDKSISGSAFYARNISKRKENERAILEAKEKAEEASKAKAQFLSNISHELRTPLNGIIAITRILLGEPLTDGQRQNLEVLKYSGDHMLSLIDDVLDFNKIEAGKMIIDKNSFNLQHAMQGLVNPFKAQANERKIGFEVSLPQQLDQTVVGDLTRLNQVMNNLLGNAFKFTPKGKVGLTVTVIEQLSETMRVRFAVSDTGIGIAPEKMDKIFDSFTQADVRTTRKYGGTGLGLTISKRLTELMEGTLNVVSKPGHGSTFTIELPFAMAHRMTHIKREKSIDELYKFDGVKVLLAEDNPINLMVANTILNKWGMEVTAVENGQNALIALAQNGAFDLILMDLEMPVMDGVTAAREISCTHPHIPIIAFTAAIYENMRQDLLQKGMSDFVPKPFKPEQLHNAIGKALKKNGN
jgi:signal transduction histidine kinase/CheY-like chemotaxis protein